jgi:hypothetical protein
MKHADFNNELFRAFPSLREAARTEFGYMREDQLGSYLIFEGILVPEIDKASASDEDYFLKLMDFVERVAEPGIGACDDLVEIGLGERLSALSNADRIRSVAGPNTTRALRKSQRTGWYKGPLASIFERLVLGGKARRAD